MKRKTYLAALAAISTAAVVGSAAARSSESDAAAIAQAKIDLGRAVAAAEQSVGGKASRAEYERHQGKWVFDVEVVKGKSVIDVKVDAQDGKVIESRADQIDDDEGERAD